MAYLEQFLSSCSPRERNKLKVQEDDRHNEAEAGILVSEINEKTTPRQRGTLLLDQVLRTQNLRGFRWHDDHVLSKIKYRYMYY